MSDVGREERRNNLERAKENQRRERQEHRMAEKLKATIIPDAMRDAQEQIATLRAELAQFKDTLKVWRRVNEAMETVPSYLSTPDGERLLADARMKLRFVLQNPPTEGVSAALDRLKVLKKVVESLRADAAKDVGFLRVSGQTWDALDELNALDALSTSGPTLGEGEK